MAVIVRVEPATLYMPDSVVVWGFVPMSHAQLLPEVLQDADENVSLAVVNAALSWSQVTVWPFVVKHEFGIV